MTTKNIDFQTDVYGADFPDILMRSSRQVMSMYADYPDGLYYSMHHHLPCQFFYASRGVLTVKTEKGTWIVPQSHAVWIPSNTSHQVLSPHHLTLRNIYIRPGAAPNLLNECAVVTMPPLLRELTVYAADFATEYSTDSHEERVIGIILDLLQQLETVPFLLPSPRDRRLQVITSALLENPGDIRTLEEWGQKAGATSRTLSRLFRQETGMSFKQWRQQARLMEAIVRLTSGESVNLIALNLGYNSVSAFVAMFRKHMGITPGKYIDRNEFTHLEKAPRPE